MSGDRKMSWYDYWYERGVYRIINERRRKKKEREQKKRGEKK